MSNGSPDEFSLEMLAGYVDNELTPHDRARVDEWLSEHPECRDQLESQEYLTVRNTELWSAAQPIMPTDLEWSNAFDEVRKRLSSARPSSRSWIAVAAVVFSVAACLAIAVWTGDDVDSESRDEVAFNVDVAPPWPESDDAPFQFARADEILYVSLPEAAVPFLVVGEHPLQDQILLLARSNEVNFHGLGSDPDGRFPSNPADSNPPMVWAPRRP